MAVVSVPGMTFAWTPPASSRSTTALICSCVASGVITTIMRTSTLSGGGGRRRVVEERLRDALGDHRERAVRAEDAVRALEERDVAADPELGPVLRGRRVDGNPEQLPPGVERRLPQ